MAVCILYLNGVVPQAADDLVVIVLKAVDSLAVLAVALDSSQSVSSVLPVALHVLCAEER